MLAFKLLAGLYMYISTFLNHLKELKYTKTARVLILAFILGGAVASSVMFGTLGASAFGIAMLTIFLLLGIYIDKKKKKVVVTSKFFGYKK